MIPARNAVLAAFFVSLAAGCSSGGGSPDGGTVHRDGAATDGDGAAAEWTRGLASLSITPPTATLMTSPSASTTQQFHVTATYADGTTRDVTSLAGYRLDNSSPGSIDRAGLFTTSTTAGGIATLSAIAGAGSTVPAATAQITVRFAGQHFGDGVDMAVAARFTSGAANTTSTPTLVYPTDGTMMPPNISQLEVQWSPASSGGADTYDIQFLNDVTDVHIYTHCTTVGSGCGMAMDPMTWHWIAGTNRGSAPVVVMVRALLADGTVGSSSPADLSFAADDLSGGIYYWTAAAAANGIYRYDFSRGDTAPQAFFTAQQTPAIPASDDGHPDHPCTGCHALSGDGLHMATVLGGANPANVVELDVASRNITAQVLMPFAQILSYSPDASQLVASHDGAMSIISASNLAAPMPIDLGDNKGTHCEWSPTGNGIVFTRTPSQEHSIYVHHGEIAWLPAMMPSGWGAVQSLAPAVAGENHYYPSTTPDARYVVYNRSVCPGGDEGNGDCDAYDDPSAELWMVDTQLSTHQTLRLDHANARGPTDTMDARTNSWPRIAPFTSRSQGRTVYWVTFSSRRNYGLRLVGANLPQLWMVAVAVPDSEVPGQLPGDPSFSAFWLPFQDISTGNHIAQWTRAIVAIGARPLGH